MTERKRETAHKNVGRNYKKYKKKKLRKKIATLLIRKKIVKTPFTQKIQAKLKSKNKRSNQN
jgi:hypothetical protein